MNAAVQTAARQTRNACAVLDAATQEFAQSAVWGIHRLADQLQAVMVEGAEEATCVQAQEASDRIDELLALLTLVNADMELVLLDAAAQLFQLAKRSLDNSLQQQLEVA